MNGLRVVALTALAMLAFTGNSLLCRIALKQTHIDPASFTAIRLVSGALTLWIVVNTVRGTTTGKGNWLSALALFGYAAGFSFAYTSLTAATGALLLFGAVQLTMVGWGWRAGERLTRWQLLGVVLAVAGLVSLSMPGVAAPSLLGASLMLGAGVSWSAYSLRGKGAGDPVRVTGGNFLRAVPIAALWSALSLDRASLDWAGVVYAIASGALTSGIGYAIWYSALPALRATTAATVQLSVPVIATLGAAVFLGEAITWRIALASMATLGGIAMVISARRPAR